MGVFALSGQQTLIQLGVNNYIWLLMGSRAHVELKSEESDVFLGFLSCRSSLFVSHRGSRCIPDS